MDQYLFSSLKFQKCTIFLFIVTMLYVVVASVHAELHDNQIKAHRTYQSIEIDGDLTEEDWQHAEPIDEFVQIEPYEGEKGSEAMEVRVLYDNENIYFGFTCFDSNISKLVANEMRRDSRDLHETKTTPCSSYWIHITTGAAAFSSA